MPEKLRLKEVVAMGVGGMVGGGIFSVLGLAVAQAGHAAPVAFGLGAVVALLTARSYAALGIAFHSAGGSFTYLEHAFVQRNVAGIAGWLLLAGYVGTMSLYAYTFGAYGASLLGDGGGRGAVQHLLQSLVLLVFIGVNLYGVAAAGRSEDLIVLLKLLFLALFATIGLVLMDPSGLSPVFDRGIGGVLMGAALIFVAYEGFELIPNAARDMEDPSRNLPLGLYLSIGITALVYVLVATVAVGNLSPADIREHGEYALAVAAEPFLGQAGFVLVCAAALLSAASAINATLFGAARLSVSMAKEAVLPTAFSFRRRTGGPPLVALVAIGAVTLAFVNTSNLGIIASFASSTFLLTFAAINLAAVKLRHRVGAGMVIPLSGFVLCSGSWMVLMAYLASSDRSSLWRIAYVYAAVVTAEMIFSKRRCIFRPAGR